MTVFVEDAKALRECLLQSRRWGIHEMLTTDNYKFDENLEYFRDHQEFLRIVDDIIADEMCISDEMGYVPPHHDPMDAL